MTLHDLRVEGLFVEPRGSVAPLEEVLTVPEVADLLRVTTKTVYKLIRTGELRSFRVGRAVRCRRNELDRFIADREQSSAVAVEGN